VAHDGTPLTHAGSNPALLPDPYPRGDRPWSAGSARSNRIWVSVARSSVGRGGGHQASCVRGSARGRARPVQLPLSDELRSELETR